MKELTTYNRAAGYLNQIFDLLNERFFENELSKPVITIQSTPRAYGHYTLYDAWSVDGEKGMRELAPCPAPLKRLPPRCFMKWFTTSTTLTGSRIAAVATPTTIRTSVTVRQHGDCTLNTIPPMAGQSPGPVMKCFNCVWTTICGTSA